ncbi:MAG: tetratricopeptide repeat-containing protein [Methanothrix sp.]|uniref:tetratricopeptide repeat protein n=1 Tax=Methanothrix sp. TaxID=90426 RepID=UPI0025D3A14E|nr:tetratricopeptide repeat protein [Methanothrix sp.]MCK9405437.1 tetratricopeptide repeat-containing protein [Methanothrix sp.]
MKPTDLDVLPLEDAKKLLLEIADRIGGQADELARLCGCLPIALRNAASVLAERKDLGVAEYLERLQEARNRVELVEASFGLSYDLLSPELRRLWSMLSVFPAGFDRVGATAVWAMDQDSAAGSLSDLVKWSLVEFDPAIERYRLHDLARDYAASRLQADEKAEAEEQHAEHYINMLSSSKELYKQGGENLLAGLALFDREWSNIQAGQSWAERNLQDKTAAVSLCSSYPDAGIYVLELRLHPKERICWLQTALAAAKGEEDRRRERNHLGNLGNACKDLGEPRKAIEYYEQALAIAREIGDRRNEGINSWNLGLEYEKAGDIEQASDIMQLCVDFEREIGHPNAESDVRYLENLRARLGKK